ncbi:MAG: hypothetical protein LBD78_02290 [Spirochaetaceae bacterium]|jgi:hypothetical protein|nr:hypothetical protein [Spirochaetaceae bacterium]
MSSAAFRELCKTALSPADAALLDFCVLDPDPVSAEPVYGEAPAATSSAFLNKWRHWERTLRLNLARYRAQRLKREGGAPADPPEDPADATATAKAAVSMESPLEAELFLDKSRWDAIEAFQGLDYFNRNTIYAYLLKLLLMERRSLFRIEEGVREYQGLYASILAARPDDGESGEPK